ncbi:MAG: DNA repair protein RecN [Rhodoferax sp.]
MSLRRMTLRDFVIVRELDLELGPGFSVLTGETGAGKSILIDALQLVTGGRADAGVVREGAQRTEVSAEFELTPALTEWLTEAGFDADDALLLRRSVDVQGRSRGWINGSPATATQLRALGEQLLDIHGQHAWQSLTRPEAVRALLDDYGRIDTSAVAQAWRRWRQAIEQLERARHEQAQSQAERERLCWQLGEIDQLAPQPGEWDRLNADHSRLSHAQALLEAAQQGVVALADGEPGAAGLLSRALDALQRQVTYEPEFAPLIDLLNASLAQIDDVAHSLRAYLRRTELDPERLMALDERLARWLQLARRYRHDPADLWGLRERWRQNLQDLDQASDPVALAQARDAAWADYQGAARTVSAARVRAAQALGQSVTAAMQTLGMAGGRFEVTLEATGQPQQYGLEDVVLRVAGHPGSALRPVAKVASGGELSRIALAIAVCTSRLGTAQTLIFDEVDAGVGGAVAETVGRLLHRLGADRQVLAVTHLAQVAACADHHWVVRKRSEGGQTHSEVLPLDADARVNELARMLGGERLLPSTLAHARDLLAAGADATHRS